MDAPSQPANESSQTASDYIATQLRLESDAREALPYSFDTCTRPLGALRQSVFACLTCTPPPASPHQQFNPAGVCYSCSISCHGEHTLVELFTKRDFECDCGTTRFAVSGTACELRHNEVTGRKGGVVGEKAQEVNAYNQNYEGRFCGCGEEYDPEREKGTMFQCLGMGLVEEGGCGEDWWHAECLMGLPRRQLEVLAEPKRETNASLETVQEEVAVGEEAAPDGEAEAEEPLPVGFPAEDDFDHLICWKCCDAFPWIKQYAGAPGFLPAVSAEFEQTVTNGHTESASAEPVEATQSNKRKADDGDDMADLPDSKKVKADDVLSSTNKSSTKSTTNVHANSARQPLSTDTTFHGHAHPSSHPATNGTSNSTQAATDPTTLATNENATAPRHATLPPPTLGRVSLFLREDFRDTLCRCPQCFPRLAAHRQLLEEEDSYEPPLSESSEDAAASVTGRSVNSGSLLERGEAALSSMDRVRAIEGVMAYNHVKDKVKAFLAPFAETGQPVGAEEIRAYFAKLRGDEQAQREAAAGVGVSGGGGGAPRGGGGSQGAY